MTEVLYSVYALVSLAVIIVLLMFNRSTRDEHGTSFKILLIFVAVFCFIDMAWGFVASHYVNSTLENFRVLSVAFHLGVAITAYVWEKYILHYLGVVKPLHVELLLVVPVIVVAALLVSNIWTNCMFTIDSNLNYRSGYLRPIAFACEGIYFIMSLIATIVVKNNTTDGFKRERCNTLVVFCSSPILFLLLQIMFPDAPFVSCGYMISCMALYIGIVTAERSKEVSDTSRHYKEESKEIYLALEGIAKSFVSVHLFNLKINKQQPVYSNRFIDEFIKEEDGADEQIKKVMRGVCEPEYINKVVEFVDLSTLSTRMRGRRVISCEFISRNQGWCISSFIKVEQDEHGNVTKVIHAVQNINEVKLRELEYEKALSEAYKDRNVIFSEMLKMQSGGVIATDGAEHILAINDAAAKMFGYNTSDDVPTDFNILLSKMEFDNFEETRRDYNKFKAEGEGITYYFKIKNYRGNDIFVMGVPKKITMPNGRALVITSYTDISKGKEMENQLLLISQTDALTGISNRGYGEDRIEALLEAGKAGAFCIIDIDKFKSINDTYGHMVGDKALIEVAKALKSSFRDHDVVMRLGGDEFAVFAEGITNERAAKRCFDRFFEYLENLNIEELQGNKITVSLGVAFATSTGDRVFDDLYQNADSIMYMCKEQPGNCYAFKS